MKITVSMIEAFKRGAHSHEVTVLLEAIDAGPDLLRPIVIVQLEGEEQIGDVVNLFTAHRNRTTA